MSFIAVGVSAGTALLGGIIGGGKARRQRRAAARRARALEKQLEAIKRTRPPVPDLASNISDLSGIAQDLSGMITNPYANLGVATSAAEIQMEQSDIALANTLDTLRATGSGAGGATALAQAALQSKKDVAANIEQQEAQNEKLAAQGEVQMQQAKMSEQQRLQGIQISEGQRVQQAEMMADQFEFGAKEKRVDQDLNRVASQLGQQQQVQAQAASAEGAAWASALGGVSSAFAGAIGEFGGGK